MAVIAGYSCQKKELKAVFDEIRLAISKITDDDLEMTGFHSINDFIEYIKGKEILDLVCVDIANDALITVAEWIRKNHTQSVIMICADSSVSPAKYMKPSIMAASLLLRPYDEQQLKNTVNDLVSYMEQNFSAKANEKSSFMIKTKDTHQYIPYNKILYFEARNKKIYLNTAMQEYAFYETMDTLEKQLSDGFVRCHRGFLVNIKKIKRVNLSFNEIELENDVVIPLSKSCKAKVKELSK